MCLRKLSLFRGKETIIFFERGTTAGGVGDDGVEILAEKDGEVCSREIASGISNARVSGKRSATELSFGYDDFTAVGGEDANGGFIEPRECDVGDAAGEESDTGAARTARCCGRCRS